jgi:bifunctional DNA-binding transcriptional regulator/antitoxin component of YhaV-PrlF toxin-antitoxin module
MSGVMDRPFVAKVTANGQISLPAEVRRRWDVDRVVILDRGTHVIVRALPADPIAAFRGRYKSTGPRTDELREIERAADERAEADKVARVGSR